MHSGVSELGWPMWLVNFSPAGDYLRLNMWLRESGHPLKERRLFKGRDLLWSQNGHMSLGTVCGLQELVVRHDGDNKRLRHTQPQI